MVPLGNSALMLPLEELLEEDEVEDFALVVGVGVGVAEVVGAGFSEVLLVLTFSW
jgi:hypothetical protein